MIDLAQPIIRVSGDKELAKSIFNQWAMPALYKLKESMKFQGLAQLSMAPKILPDGSFYSVKSVYGVDIITIYAAPSGKKVTRSKSANVIIFLYRDINNQFSYELPEDAAKLVESAIKFEWPVIGGCSQSVAISNEAFSDYHLRVEDRGYQILFQDYYQYNSRYNGAFIVGNEGDYIPGPGMFSLYDPRQYDRNFKLEGIAGTRHSTLKDPAHDDCVIQNLFAQVDPQAKLKWTKENPVPYWKVHYDGVDGHVENFLPTGAYKVFAVLGPDKGFYIEQPESDEVVKDIFVPHKVSWKVISSTSYSESHNDSGTQSTFSSSTTTTLEPIIQSYPFTVSDDYTVKTKVYFGSTLIETLEQKNTGKGSCTIVEDIPAQGNYPYLSGSSEYNESWFYNPQWDNGWASNSYTLMPNVEYLRWTGTSTSGPGKHFDWLDFDYDPTDPEGNFIMFYTISSSQSGVETLQMTFLYNMNDGAGYEYIHPEYHYTREVKGTKVEFWMQWCCKGSAGKTKLAEFKQSDFKTVDIYRKLGKEMKTADFITFSSYPPYFEAHTQIAYEVWSYDPAFGYVSTSLAQAEPWTISGNKIGEVSCFMHTKYLCYTFNKYRWIGGELEKNKFDWFKGIWNHDPAAWVFEGRVIVVINRETGQAYTEELADIKYKDIMDLDKGYAIGVIEQEDSKEIENVFTGG